MLTFDQTAKTFLLDGKEISFSPSEIERMNSMHWYQQIPFASKVTAPGYYRCAELEEKYFLHQLKLDGKSVLGIGCYEGFQLYMAEALGAARVVGITDTFGYQPSIEAARNFAAQKLQSKVAFLDMPLEEVSVERLGHFDIVFFFDAIPHVVDPYGALERLSKIATTAIFVTTPVVLSHEGVSACYRLHSYDPVYPSRNKHGISSQWLLDELIERGLSCGPAKLWEHDYLSVCALKDGSRQMITIPPIDALPTDNGMEEKTAVLVMSCRLYEQCWMPFFTLFKKYWPDCPYRVFLGTDTGSYPGVETIEVGQDLQWSSNIIHILNRINAERIILFQEDFLLSAPVDTQLVRKIVRHSLDHDIASTRLFGYPAPTGLWRHTSYLGTVGPFEDYRFTFQLTLWDKAYYLSLMVPGEDPWTTEYVAARRSILQSKPFLGIWPQSKIPVPYFAYAVDKGEWQDSALEFLRREEISLANITKKIRSPLHRATKEPLDEPVSRGGGERERK